MGATRDSRSPLSPSLTSHCRTESLQGNSSMTRCLTLGDCFFSHRDHRGHRVERTMSDELIENMIGAASEVRRILGTGLLQTIHKET